jgi:tetratricopeptide (TPR) repeat protein
LAEQLLGLAKSYRVLAPVREALNRAWAENLMRLGVVEEKLGEKEASKQAYERSISIYPLAETHYDYAVLFWNIDRAIAQRELEEALRLNPGYAPARQSLDKLRTIQRSPR